MANDLSVVQDGQTAYVWGGWNASGFHTMMYIVDLQTGAVRAEPLGRTRFLAQGFVTNPEWDWIPGKLLYLGADGIMTQTRPVGIITVVGIAYTATKICLDTRPPKEET
jgi:hypothetical protein